MLCTLLQDHVPVSLVPSVIAAPPTSSTFCQASCVDQLIHLVVAISCSRVVQWLSLAGNIVQHALHPVRWRIHLLRCPHQMFGGTTGATAAKCLAHLFLLANLVISKALVEVQCSTALLLSEVPCMKLVALMQQAATL